STPSGLVVAKWPSRATGLACATTSSESARRQAMRRFLGKLYVQVLIGVFAPELGSDLKPLGDAFIKLIKMVFAPIIFATVVLGIAKMENMKELGRVGVR